MANRKNILIPSKAQLRGFRKGLKYAYIDGKPQKCKRGYKIKAVGK